MEKAFDFVVIGGGSGGLASARRAAKLGKKVCVVEGSKLGGTCVNVGCVPKKIMWNTANMIDELKISADMGVNANYSLDWARLCANRQAHILNLNEIYYNNVVKDGVELIRGWGVFKNSHTIEVEGVGELTAPHILISTGSKSVVLNIPGKEYVSYSDDFFAMDSAPESALIIGNGYIAAELGGMLNSFGTKTSITMRDNSFVRVFDHSMAEFLRETMEGDGVSFLPDRNVIEIRKQEDDLLAIFDNGDQVPYKKIFACIGRLARLDGMGLENIGIERLPNGAIKTNEYEETSIEGVYSVGDVNGKIQLTPVAIAAGRKLADRLFGGQPEAKLDYSLIPSVMFSHPPNGRVGMTENEARAKYGDQVKVYRSRFNNLFYSVSSHKVPTLMKLVCLGEEEKVIGLHGVGKGVDEIVQGFAVAIRMGATKKDFDDTVAIHPTAAEEYVTMT